MIINPIVSVDSSADRAQEDRYREQAQRERAARTRKAEVQHMADTLRKENAAQASVQRMHVARDALRALSLEREGAAHDDAAVAQQLEALDAQSSNFADVADLREALPTFASERPDVDMLSEFDRGWSEALPAEQPAPSHAGIEEGKQPQPMRASPGAQAPRVTQPQAPQPVRRTGAADEFGELPQDVTAALDRLHVLSQERSDCKGAGNLAGAHAVDDRIEGTLSFLEGYVLDAAEGQSSEAAQPQLSALLAKVREGMRALRESRPSDDEVGVAASAQEQAPNAVVPPAVTPPPLPPSAAPLSGATPVARPTRAPVNEPVTASAASNATAARRSQTSRRAEAASEHNPQAKAAAAAQDVKRLHEALESEDQVLDQQAALDERRATTTLPQRVVQSV